MTGVFRLESDAPALQGLEDRIGIFTIDQSGNEVCVGEARARDTDYGLLYFASMYGNIGTKQTLNFKWHSHLTDLEYDVVEKLTFVPSGLAGSLENPTILHFEKSIESVPSIDQGLVAYPNPFNDELTIHWHGTEQVVELRIEDTSGRLIDILDCDHLGTGPCRWNATAAESGMYVIHAITEDRSYSVRVIK